MVLVCFAPAVAPHTGKIFEVFFIHTVEANERLESELKRLSTARKCNLMIK